MNDPTYLIDRLCGTADTEDALHRAIPRLAYKFWEDEGRPHGRDRIHWHRACWALDPFPDFPPDDIAGEVPEFNAAMAEQARENDAWSRANRQDFEDLIPDLDTVLGHVAPPRVSEPIPFPEDDDPALIAGIARLTRTLDETDRLARLKERPRAPTLEEFVEVRRALGYPRADVLEEVFLTWNEDQPSALRARFDAAWPAILPAA